jgi:hypothetical protein
MCVTQRGKFIISEKKMGPIIPLFFILCGMLKDSVYINVLQNEGDMKWNAEWYSVLRWYDMSWNKKKSHNKWGIHYLLPCPGEKEIELLLKNGVRTYRREVVVSEEEIDPWVLVALVAHHTPTVMLVD